MVLTIVKKLFLHQVDLGIEYNRYLREVVETLEKDDAFRKKLETADEADIRVCRLIYVLGLQLMMNQIYGLIV